MQVITAAGYFLHLEYKNVHETIRNIPYTKKENY